MAGETRILVPAVDVASRTDPGRDPTKQVNEDACGWRETAFGVLCVVCDGMGGHVGGREASNAAMAQIFEAFERAPLGTPPREVLRDAIRLANVRVRGLSVHDEGGAGRRPSDEGGRPGSTAVAILIHSQGTEVAHVGDSRAYLVHQGQIFQLTRDHSMVQEMVEAKILTPAQAAVHPEANKITRALGIDDDVDVELRAPAIAHVTGDAFVLCSDGLSDLVEPPEILQIVASDPPPQAVGRLVDLANARGGHDNVTVVVARPRSSASAPIGPVAPTVADSQQVTLRPPQAPIRIPAAPPPTPTQVEEVQRRERSKQRMPLVALAAIALALLAGIAIVYARAMERSRRAHQAPPAAIDAAASSSPSIAPTPTGSVLLAPVAPPDAGEPDAAEVTPLAPASSSPVRHSRHHGRDTQ